MLRASVFCTGSAVAAGAAPQRVGGDHLDVVAVFSSVLKDTIRRRYWRHHPVATSGVDGVGKSMNVETNRQADHIALGVKTEDLLVADIGRDRADNILRVDVSSCASSSWRTHERRSSSYPCPDARLISSARQLPIRRCDASPGEDLHLEGRPSLSMTVVCSDDTFLFGVEI